MHITSPKSLWITTKVYFLFSLHADSFGWLLFCNMCLLMLKPKLKKKPYLEHAIFMAERIKRFHRTIRCLWKFLLGHGIYHFRSHFITTYILLSYILQLIWQDLTQWSRGVQFYYRYFSRQVGIITLSIETDPQLPELHTLSVSNGPLHFLLMNTVGSVGSLATT